MEIRVGNKAFAAALARAAGFVTRGGTLPILNCVALTAGGGRLTIESSNLEQALRQTITISGVGVGGGCVDWDKLASASAVCHRRAIRRWNSPVRRWWCDPVRRG